MRAQGSAGKCQGQGEIASCGTCLSALLRAAGALGAGVAGGVLHESQSYMHIPEPVMLLKGIQEQLGCARQVVLTVLTLHVLGSWSERAHTALCYRRPAFVQGGCCCCCVLCDSGDPFSGHAGMRVSARHSRDVHVADMQVSAGPFRDARTCA